MMNNWLIIALVSGLAAAALQSAVVSGSAAAILLFYLAPLPLFIAGLGWGPVTAGAAALVGAVTMTATIGFEPGLFFLVSSGLAPIVISHLALINRPARADGPEEGEASDNKTEWYPEGRLILWCAGIGCALMTATVFLIGGSADGFNEVVQQHFAAILAQISQTMPIDEVEAVKKVAEIFLPLVAPVSASIWLLATLLNIWIASRILRGSGRSPRPWAPFSSYTLPRAATLWLGGAGAASFLPGTLGLIGQIGFSLMVTVFTIIGLSAVHGLTIGNPMRAIILGTLYLSLLVLSWIIVLPLMILALADQQFNLRQRRLKPGGTDDE
jgi:hypothetical protein